MSFSFIYQVKTVPWLICDKSTSCAICVVTASSEEEAVYRAGLLRSEFVKMPPDDQIYAEECSPEFMQGSAELNHGFFLVVDVKETPIETRH